MFVSLIMLTASVFPHHHHNALLCMQHDALEAHVCGAEECTHTHANDSEEEHGATGCTDCCITVFHFSVPNNEYDDIKPCPTLILSIFTLADMYVQALSPEEDRTHTYIYYHEKLHSKYTTRAKGLRAPPSFIA